MSVYRVTEIIGSSRKGWEDAARQALGAAATSLRDLRVAEVVEQDVTLGADGQVDEFRTKLRVSFKYERAGATAPRAKSSAARAKPRKATA